MNNTGRNRWGRYKTVNGVKHKLCNGPLHGEDGAWLPITDFWIMKRGKRAGKPHYACIECERHKKNRREHAGVITIARVAFVFREIISRVGRAEAARRIGISKAALYQIEHRKYKNIYKVTAIKAIHALRELRQKDIVRHKDSIHNGSYLRGRPEKRVTAKKHLYISHGDSDTELKHRTERERAA